MAVTKIDKFGVTSKVEQVCRVEISSWAQNDEVVISHAKDPLNARIVSVIDAASNKLVHDDAKYQIVFTSEDTTTIKALASSPVAVNVVLVVPTT